MFKRMLIANRGEIGMRILRCCQEMGIETVVAYSSEDANTLPVTFSPVSVCIGPAAPSKSYLNQDALIQAAISYKCDAIHPGYGFLSENAEFAKKCEMAGIKFIGPSSKMIKNMGEKSAARSLMKAKGVPVVPGSDGLVRTVEEAKQFSEKMRIPLFETSAKTKQGIIEGFSYIVNESYEKTIVKNTNNIIINNNHTKKRNNNSGCMTNKKKRNFGDDKNQKK